MAQQRRNTNRRRTSRYDIARTLAKLAKLDPSAYPVSRLQVHIYASRGPTGPTGEQAIRVYLHGFSLGVLYALGEKCGACGAPRVSFPDGLPHEHVAGECPGAKGET